MTSKYLFQINKLGPVSLEQFKELKLKDINNSSNNYSKEELYYLLDYLRQNNPAMLSLCEIIKFYVNSDEEIEREIFYLCLNRINKYKKFLTNFDENVNASYTENENVYMIHPDDNEFSIYSEKIKKYDTLSKKLNINLCDKYGKFDKNSIEDNYIENSLYGNIIEKNKISKSKFKLFKPNVNTLNKFTKLSDVKKSSYKPPVTNSSKNYTVIVKGIPTDLFYKEVESRLRAALRLFKNNIISIKVVKSVNNTNKGIAFIDIYDGQILKKILDMKIVIENMILSIEKKS